MVKLENNKNVKIISLENLISFSRNLNKSKEIKKILERFDNNNRVKLAESYNLQNILEKIIKTYVEKQFKQKQRFEFKAQYVGFDSPDMIPKVEPNIEYASSTFLNYLAGNNSQNTEVLGAYDPRTNTIYVLNTLYGREHDKTLHHEKEHWQDPNASEHEIRRRTAMAGYI